MQLHSLTMGLKDTTGVSMKPQTIISSSWLINSRDFLGALAGVSLGGDDAFPGFWCARTTLADSSCKSMAIYSSASISVLISSSMHVHWKEAHARQWVNLHTSHFPFEEHSPCGRIAVTFVLQRAKFPIHSLPCICCRTPFPLRVSHSVCNVRLGSGRIVTR